LNFKI